MSPSPALPPDPNPLHDPKDRRLTRVAGPSALVLFGVTGDLAQKTLLPAIYDLMNRGLAAGRLDTMDPEEAPNPPIEGDEEASRWYAYHRTDRPCLRCSTPIREALMQNRRLFWCPSCQR